MADSPEKLPQLVLSKYKTAGDENMLAAAVAAHPKSPSRLLTLPFDKITKQAGMADINNASMTKGEKTPLNAMLNNFNPTTSNTPMAQQQPQSNSDRNQTSDNESNTSGKKALKNVA